MIRIEYDIRHSRSPLLAIAAHNGHEMDRAIESYLAVDEFTRLREEDPFTGLFARISKNYLIVQTSRFQTDVNRSKTDAVYRSPEQSWGLQVWNRDLPVPVLEQLAEEYDLFYKQLDHFINGLISVHGFLVVYDFHSYNHRRDPDRGEANPEENPEINIGTSHMNRSLWAAVVDSFKDQMSHHDYFGRRLDVRENVKFKGGYLSQWIHEHYPDESCVMAIEVKKFFMDEWSGAVDQLRLEELRKAFLSTVPGVLREAEKTAEKTFRKRLGISL